MIKSHIPNIKDFFPIFNNIPNLVYWDSAATALKPKIVIDKMVEYYTKYSANIHRGLYPISERATLEYEAVRQKVADFIGAKNEEIIFTSGTTESINLVARGMENMIGEGDEIVVSEAEHHSNLVPWQELCQRKRAKLVVLVMDGQWEKIITKNTKLVAITQVSNVLGIINDIEAITKKIKTINPKTLVLVDAAQSVAHVKIEVSRMGGDFLAFSGHKIYGPTGVGVLWGKRDVLKEIEPVKFGGGMIREVKWEHTEYADGPARFEGGTPAIGEVVGLGAAIDFVNSLGWKEIEEQEKRVLQYLLISLQKIDGLKIFGSTNLANRIGVVAMTLEGVHPHDVADILGKREVCVRAGHHCAQPLHQKLGVEATFRASMGIYNDEADVDKLVEGIGEVKRIFKK